MTTDLKSSLGAALQGFTANDALEVADSLQDACTGHPEATIPWPHRLLHQARDTIRALVGQLAAKNEEIAALREEAEANPPDGAGNAPTPTRIQRSRKKGAKLPPNTVSICRPGIYGNPFVVVERRDGRHKTWVVYRKIGRCAYSPKIVFPTKAEARAEAVARFRTELLALTSADRAARLAPLRNADHIACWCALDAPCHGDVLIELLAAEQPASVPGKPDNCPDNRVESDTFGTDGEKP